jgi:DNA-binding SARP family transcriptional activator
VAAELAGVGRPAAAIERSRRLIAMDPEREGWHRALMRAYVQAGERPLALRQYHACRATQARPKRSKRVNSRRRMGHRRRQRALGSGADVVGVHVQRRTARVGRFKPPLD